MPHLPKLISAGLLNQARAHLSRGGGAHLAKKAHLWTLPSRGTPVPGPGLRPLRAGVHLAKGTPPTRSFITWVEGMRHATAAADGCLSEGCHKRPPAPRGTQVTQGDLPDLDGASRWSRCWPAA